MVKLIGLDAGTDAAPDAADTKWEVSTSMGSSPDWKSASVVEHDGQLILRPSWTKEFYSVLPSRRQVMNWGGDVSLLAESGWQALVVMIQIIIGGFAAVALWRAAAE